MAYLSQVKANGYQYIYLTEYCGNNDYSMKFERHIYGFGNGRTVLEKMKGWLKDFDNTFPEELKTKGYTKDDLNSWIKTLETGRTRRGKVFKFEHVG